MAWVTHSSTPAKFLGIVVGRGDGLKLVGQSFETLGNSLKNRLIKSHRSFETCLQKVVHIIDELVS